MDNINYKGNQDKGNPALFLNPPFLPYIFLKSNFLKSNFLKSIKVPYSFLAGEPLLSSQSWKIKLSIGIM